MPNSEELVEKIRKKFAGHPDVIEQGKMGGISFMVNGKVCVRANPDNSMMMRCAPEMTETFLAKKGVKRFEMKGRTTMKGWLVIQPQILLSKKDFDYWMKVAMDYNGALTKGK